MTNRRRLFMMFSFSLVMVFMLTGLVCVLDGANSNDISLASGTYTITYDGNGKTDGDVPTDGTEYAEGSVVDLAGNTGNLTRSGYVFGGWAESKNSTTALSQVTMGAENKTVYAVWLSAITEVDFDSLPKYYFLNTFSSPITLSSNQNCTIVGSVAGPKSVFVIRADSGYAFENGFNHNNMFVGSEKINDAISLTDCGIVGPSNISTLSATLGTAVEEGDVFVKFDLSVVPHNHEGAQYNNGLDRFSENFTLSSGYYYICEDITLTSDLIVSGGNTVNLCLNGKKLNLNGYKIINNGTLNIYDCNDEQKYYFEKVSSVWTLTNTTTENYVVGGIITGGIASDNVIINNGILNLYGGNISGNKENAPYNSCTIKLNNGATLNIDGGSIRYNNNEYAVLVGNNGDTSKSSLIINSGAISDNSGNGVNVGSFFADIKIKGGEVSRNAGNYAFSIDFGANEDTSDVAFEMSGGKVEYNKRGFNFVYCDDATRVKFIGGYIEHNTNGAINPDEVNLTLGGGVIIKDNTAFIDEETPRNICLSDCTKITFLADFCGLVGLTPPEADYIFAQNVVSKDYLNYLTCDDINYAISSEKSGDTYNYLFINKYTVEYSVSWGTGTAPASVFAEEGTEITLPSTIDATLEHFTFYGWSEESGNFETRLQGGAKYTITKDVTLYALWAEEARFDLMDGNMDYYATGENFYNPTAYTFYSSEYCPFDDLSKITFGGWSTSKSGEGKTAESLYVDKGANGVYDESDFALRTVYYAIWLNEYGKAVTFFDTRISPSWDFGLDVDMSQAGWTWDFDTKTLTLSNTTFANVYVSGDYTLFDLDSYDEVTVVINGTNKFGSTMAFEEMVIESYGAPCTAFGSFLCTVGDIKITGDGSLTIYDYYYGIKSENGGITFPSTFTGILKIFDKGGVSPTPPPICCLIASLDVVINNGNIYLYNDLSSSISAQNLVINGGRVIIASNTNVLNLVGDFSIDSDSVIVGNASFNKDGEVVTFINTNNVITGYGDAKYIEISTGSFISFIGGEGATGTAPNTRLLAVGSKIILPNNPFVKVGYKFLGWSDGVSTYDAGVEYTIGESDVELYAEWQEKTAVTINDSAQAFTYGDENIKFSVTGTTLTGFLVKYYVSGAWTEVAPTNAGNYNVKVERQEDVSYKAFEEVITNGLQINKLTLILTLSNNDSIVKTYGESFVEPTATTNKPQYNSYVTFNKKYVKIVGTSKSEVTEIKNAGSYNIEFSATSTSDNIVISNPLAVVIVTINKAQAEITVDTQEIKVLEGSEVVLPEATTNYGEVVCNKRAEDLTAVGKYTIIYKVEEGENYLGTQKTLSVIIQKKEVERGESNAEYEDSSKGFDPDVTLVITEGNPSAVDKTKVLEALQKTDIDVKVLYNVSLMKGGVEISPGGRMKITLSIPDSIKDDASLRVVCIKSDGTVSELSNATIVDGKLVFSSDELLSYAFVVDHIEMPSSESALSVGGIVGICFAVVIFIIIILIISLYALWKRELEDVDEDKLNDRKYKKFDKVFYKIYRKLNGRVRLNI